MAQENLQSLRECTSYHESPYKKDPKIAHEDSWSDSNEDDHEEVNELCLMAVGYQKNQMALSISTTKAEYLVAERACQQALWMKQAMKDYDIHCKDVLLSVTTNVQ
nr:hypothetical protein [Tanacetum cinerariifolium]